MRLIDADELKQKLIDYDSWLMHNENGNRTDVHKIIDYAPTIDAVEVVRCRACRYWKPYNEDKDLGECDYYGTDEYDDDFCSKPIYWKEIKPEK